jgi:serine/threonine protein kinase
MIDGTQAADDDYTPEDRKYVLKAYTDSRYRPLYTNEARALTTLQQPKNENIVGYYGSFVQNGTFNLLLQFADGGNLLDYYGNTPPPTDPADVRRFWRSLFSVFKGLHAVHRIAPSIGDAGEYRG